MNELALFTGAGGGVVIVGAVTQGGRMRPYRHYGRAHWWTLEEWETLLDGISKGHMVEIGPRRNRRHVRCRRGKHILCMTGEAVMVWVDGERVGFCCPACVWQVQCAMGMDQVS